MWPRHAVNSPRNPAHLHVLAADAGMLPPCTASEPIFWVQLSGHIRTFTDNAEDLRRFLDASSTCWFVVLFVPNVLESSRAWWQSKSYTKFLQKYDGTSTIPQRVRKAAQHFVGGGFAYAIVERAFEMPASPTNP